MKSSLLVKIMPVLAAGVGLLSPLFLAQSATPDFTWRHPTTGSDAIWIMNNATSVGNSLLYPDPVSGWQIVGTGDFDSDGQTDIVWQSDTTEEIVVWFMDGQIMRDNSLFDPPAAGQAGWRVVGVADFNQDTKPDLLWQHIGGASPTAQVAIWYMDGITSIGNTLTTPSTPSPATWRIAGTADFNSDGQPDLLWQNTDGSIALWYMNGATATSTTLTTPSNPGDARWRIVDAADFNLDGKPDLLFQHTGTPSPTGKIAYWYMNNASIISSTLTNPEAPSPNTWRLAAAGDFTLVADSDSDGLPDSWETQYFGHLNWNRTHDPDNDGVNNGDEYAYGTDPSAGPFVTSTSYAGIKKSEQIEGGTKADAMGAVGPDHFVELINSMIAVYDKSTGVRLKLATTRDFFALDLDGNGTPEYPPAPPVDSRIVYDHDSQHWIACTLDTASDIVILAVSNKGTDSTNPIGSGGSDWIEENWTKYRVDFSREGFQPDYPTLGVDQNGIYIGIDYFAVLGSGNTPKQGVAAIWKEPLISANPPPPSDQGTVIDNLLGPALSLQAAVNMDPNPLGGVAWFVTSLLNGNSIRYYRLKWNGTTPEQPVSWNEIQIPHVALPVDAEQPSPGVALALTEQAGRLMNAVIRTIGGATYLWTSHHAGVDQTGASSQFGGNDRMACVWYKFQIEPNGSSYVLANLETGRLYDANQTATPTFYYMPSLAVNARGDMLMGFSASSVNEYIGAYYAGRLVTDAPGTMRTPQLLHSGEGPYGNVFWGDFTYTSVDPDDGLALWTVQQYAISLSEWGLWIGKVNPF